MDAIYAYEYLMWGGKEGEETFFPVVPIKSSCHKLKHMKLHLNRQKNFFTIHVINHLTDCQERLWCLHPQSYLKPGWTWPEEPGLGDLTLSKGFQ